MRRLKRFRKNQNGELMLEALIVYSITVFLLFFILAIFSVLFQRWNIQTIANESAVKVAQTYKLLDANVVSGFAEEEDILGIRPYRYVWNGAEAEDAVNEKVLAYVPERLRKTTFTKEVTEPKIIVEVVRDSLARRHIALTIIGEYTVPFGEALAYFGFGRTTEYKVTAYADCVDLIDYVNTTDFIATQTSLGKFESVTIEFIDSVLKLFTNIKVTFFEGD